MALQRFCVASIATSIDGYHRLFSTTEDRNLRRGLNLLQKVYSHELVFYLQARGNLQGKYADLVFNNYLRTLNTKAFNKFSSEEIMDTFAKIGHNLEKIDFDEDFQPSVKWEEIIHNLSSVKSVRFQECCYDTILKRIAAYCPKLETLDVTSSQGVTDAGLMHLCRMTEDEGKCPTRKVPCPDLKEIYLNDTSVDEWGIKQLLENLSSLEKIEHSEVPYALYMMHKDDLGHLDKMKKYNLTRLDLFPMIFSQLIIYDDILKVSVTSCPNVKSIECTVFKPEHIAFCSTLINVEDVALVNGQTASLDVSGFLKETGANMASLTLYNFTLSLSILGQGCPRLKQLCLNSVTFQDNANDPIPIFHELKALNIHGVDLSVSPNFRGICHILKSSPLLEYMSFFNYSKSLSLPSEMKKEILKCCELCALESIVFGICSSIELQFLEALLKTCSSLNTLHLILCDNSAGRDDLERIAYSMPNKPAICIYQK